MTLNLKAKIYNDEKAARKHLERVQWPDGPICPHCGVIDEATLMSGSSTRPGTYKCRACEMQFSVTVGTVMERSHIPLTKWLLAVELLSSSKKGISAHQLHRMLGITYKSAWFLAHRIREAMAPAPGSEPPLGGDGFVVEADETYIGKKDGPKGRKHPSAGGYGHKRTVLSLVERGGKIKSFKLGGNTKAEIGAAISATVDPASTLHTDKTQAYRYLLPSHESVDHGKEYVREGKTGEKVHPSCNDPHHAQTSDQAMSFKLNPNF